MGRTFLALALASGLFIALAGAALAQNQAPVVTNVSANQVAGTGFVRITYDVADADGDSVNVWILGASNSGSSFDLTPRTITGDVNKKLVPGPGKVIMWNAAMDYPGRYFPTVVVRVVATDGVGPGGEMVYVPGGTFTMGNTEQPGISNPHLVQLSPYYIDKYEVTVAEYKQFVDAGGYNEPLFWSTAGWAWKSGLNQPPGWGQSDYHMSTQYPSFPVVYVTYYEAEAYAAFVGKRLPTEAEWEYAARGTDGRIYPWGSSIDSTRANFSISRDPYEHDAISSTPVGFYDGGSHGAPAFNTTDSPSPFGLYDMAGNAREWVRDWFEGHDGNPTVDPQGPSGGSTRVNRGGGFWSNKYGLRSDLRSYDIPGRQSGDYGFRLAKSAP